MKFSLISEKFKKGIELISKITTRKLALPILENILFSCEKNFLVLKATNLETGIFWRTLAKVEKEGDICIRKKIVENLASFLPSGKIDFEKKDLVLEIKSENFLTKIKGEDPREYPIIPQPKEEDYIFVNSKTFCDALKKVVNLPSPSLDRPEISGVLIKVSQSEMKFVGTDRFRLAEERIFQRFEISRSFSLILPQSSAKEIINIFSKEDKEIKLYFSPNQIFLETKMVETKEPEIIFTSRLIEGEYPNYEEVLPKKFELEASFKTEDFLRKIKAAGLFTLKNNEVKLNFLPNENKVEILSQNPDFGEFKSEIFGKMKGKEMKISFNFKFLLDGVLNIEEDEFIFSLTDPEGPAMIKPKRAQDFYYLLMPIKTS